MQCSQCGKTGFVTIGGKRFCSNCGTKLNASAAAAAPTTTMADIKSSRKTLDLRSAGPTQTKSAAAVTAAASNAKPAGQFHGRQVSGAAVLDLRAKSTTPAGPPLRTLAVPKVAAVPTPKPTTEPVVATPPESPKTAQPVPAASVSTVPPGIVPTPDPPTTTPPSVVTPKKSVVVARPSAPAVDPYPSTSATQPSKPLSPLFKKFPAHPTVAQPGANTMPSAVGAKVDTMKGLAEKAPLPPKPQSPALRQALTAAKQSTATPSVLKIGAALVAIGIMSGVVWLQNSPKLAFRNDASQAGIDASLPTYVPSSYHQKGSIGVSPGQLTLNFTSPSVSQPLSIIQRRSDWDANALRENYVTQQTTSFLAVQGQGLTIYLYNGQANWINHGVWYQLSGVSKLNRDDILKIAYGL